jgi:hypothetical protein
VAESPGLEVDAVKIRFQEVKLKATRHWLDENGKKRQETRTFMQTINPFNKGAAGLPKSYDQIMGELLKEREAWLRGG